MAHIHSVYDTDNHFVINPITKAIRNESNSKVKLMQGDHNSERFTFEIPRYVEGHDMSLCDKVLMHFDNIDSKTKEESKNVFISKDVQLSHEDKEVVIFSFLIENTATKFGGSLNFLIEFICVAEDATIDYAWHTDIFTGITVGVGIHNTEQIAEENKDLLEQFKLEVLTEVDNKLASGGGSGIVSDEQIAEAVEKYMEENQVEGNVTVDTELSETSTNPVANSTVTKKFSQLSDTIDDFNAVSESMVLYDDTTEENEEETIPINSANGTTYNIGVTNEGVPFVSNTSDEKVWTPSSSGGSAVSVEQVLTEGTEIAKVTVDGITKSIYAPSSSGGNACDLYEVTVEEDTTQIDVFSGKEYKRIEAFVIAKAETSEKMIFYPCAKYCAGTGNIPNSYFGAEKFEAVIFDNSVNATNLFTCANGFAGGFTAPVSANVNKKVIDQFYMKMATETNVFKSGTFVKVYAYK